MTFSEQATEPKLSTSHHYSGADGEYKHHQAYVAGCPLCRADGPLLGVCCAKCGMAENYYQHHPQEKLLPPERDAFGFHAYVPAPPAPNRAAPLVRRAVLDMARKLCREQEAEWHGKFMAAEDDTGCHEASVYGRAADALGECLALEEAE